MIGSMKMTADQHLAGAPEAVRRRMLQEDVELEAGAAAVLGRFFRIVGERREPVDLPSAESYRRAATSESTFRTLLRALARFAPETSTAAAVEVKQEWVARRPKTSSGEAFSCRPPPSSNSQWPLSWRALLPGLQTARIKESSKRRYRASIDRCAEVVAALRLDEDLGFLLAIGLEEAFRADDVRPVTIAGYLDGLIALGKHGGADSRHSTRCA